MRHLVRIRADPHQSGEDTFAKGMQMRDKSFQQLYREEVREIIMRHRAEKLAEISAYTHAVLYYDGKRYHAGTLADCEQWAAECGRCTVVVYTDEMRDADIAHAMSWRPYTRHFTGNGDLSGW